MSPVRIEDLRAGDSDGFEQTVRVLVEAFEPVGWPASVDAARGLVRGSLDSDRVSLVARDESSAILGWIAGNHAYARVWELNPLAVAPAVQRQGIGRALVGALESRVAARGALTLQLGTDDNHIVATGEGRTSLAGVDLYPDPLKHLSTIRNLRGHPYEFYLACGYAITGVVPDADGIGQPDILMAKRVGRD
ncbi:MAG: GNAT family N-acetyltransferase [Dehalococcoidia bacterium]|nr:MAG: GNAT family N-acetyltransferase [Dehalococcoidia bacterium]